MSTQLRRDSFGRRTLMRETRGRGQCDWCGWQRATLYRYGWQQDSLTRGVNWARGAFCNLSCASARLDDWLCT